MKKQYILRLKKAGFSSHQIADALEIELAIVRETVGELFLGERKKDYITLQQILYEIREEARLAKIRASATHAQAATIESEALALLQTRVQVLKDKELTTRESYELCAILKTLQSYLQSQDNNVATTSRACVEVSFV